MKIHPSPSLRSEAVSRPRCSFWARLDRKLGSADLLKLYVPEPGQKIAKTAASSFCLVTGCVKATFAP